MILKHGLHLAYCTNVHPGEDWAGLPMRIRAGLIADFYFRLKVKNITSLPTKHQRRAALGLYRQILQEKADNPFALVAANAEADRLEAAVRVAWDAARVAPVLEPA